MYKLLVTVIAMVVVLGSMITAANAQCGAGDPGCTVSNGVKLENNILHNQSFGMVSNSKSGNFPIPSNPHRVMLPIYYNDPGTHNSNYVQILSIIQFQDTFSYQDLITLEGDGDVDLLINSIKNKVVPSQRQTHITIMFPVRGVSVPRGVFIGHISGEADDDNTTTVSCLAKAAQEAMDRGANVLYITNQGALRILKAFGWGVGVSFTKARLDSDMQSGNTGSVGMGMSGGHSQYEEEPFIQTVALYMTPEMIQARRKEIDDISRQAVEISQNAEAQVNDRRLSVRDSVKRNNQN